MGAAPLVLGQDVNNRGIVITDKAASYPKNIYFGFDTKLDFAEIFAIRENVGFMPLVLNSHGHANLGIGITNPSHPLHMGSGAYCSNGGVWTNASSRKYKTDIKRLTTEKAMDTLTQLDPVEFAYKSDLEEKHVGFIAEDAPDLVATKDRKGMSSMDVVAVLTKVVQKQQSNIAELEKEMAELKKKLKSR